VPDWSRKRELVDVQGDVDWVGLENIPREAEKYLEDDACTGFVHKPPQSRNRSHRGQIGIWISQSVSW
jgi:hypothetical protein